METICFDHRPETVGQPLTVKVHGMPVIVPAGGYLPLLARESHDKKDRRDKDVHADRVQIAHPFTGNIFPGEETRPDDEILHRHKKLTVEMGDVLKKMPDEVPDGFLRLQILLAAPRTIPLLYGKSTVQAGLVMSEMMSAHSFFLKILFFPSTPD